jgi:phage shock protein PspC (stress-responsive transcriptional regulator)
MIRLVMVALTVLDTALVAYMVAAATWVNLSAWWSDRP